ncbi:hypothetical protein TW95_gp1227 [Pandoravirus inopinatum]|uniref:Uncharacterized protein n=1 Tax=Pandoravirus inopinatum TaxID=1605721 RepID=A0A0B5JAJ4_9VIRU|nr:hypothetical protein TW95_gp1227 [Pandoravirus inopinatum]AJF97961.1 hypothetical protein [Pandoravirus inopinatum]
MGRQPVVGGARPHERQRAHRRSHRQPDCRSAPLADAPPAGYSPDERARGIVLLRGFRPSPEAYRQERVRGTRLTSGRELLERIYGIEERYPALTDPDLAHDQEDGQGDSQDDGEPVPPYAPVYRDALWALARDYAASPAGQQTARDMDEFIEWGYVPFG